MIKFTDITLALVLALLAEAAFAQTGAKPANPPKTDKGSAAAQSRGYVTVAAGFPMSASDFTDDRTFRMNVENGSQHSTYTVRANTGFDVSGGVRIWKMLGARLGIGKASSETPAAIQASLPHPFFFDKPRSLSADVNELSRDELAVNVGVMATLQPHRRIQIAAFVGPTMMQIDQDVVPSFSYADVYPYDSVSFSSAATARRSISKTVVGVGADVNVFVTRLIGASVGFESAQTTADLEIADGASTRVQFGGFRTRVGIAIRIP